MTFKPIRLGTLCQVLLTLAVCLGTVAIHAQTYTQGAVSGTVFDATGAAVPGAEITIHNDGTNAETRLTSDASGYFKAAQLPASIYTVTVKAMGFAPFREVNVIVQVGQISDVSPRLRTEGTVATVEVTGEAPILNFESPDMSAVLNTKSIQDLPLNGGRWSDMTLLTPAAVGDSNGFGLISFRGISPILNNIEIDGADDNQAYYSEERGRTREGYSTSKYMIQEFQVNTGVYSAEFGRAAGGVINAVTKSGSNTIHGLTYFSDRDNGWGAYNPFTTNTVNTGTATAPSFFTSAYKPKDWRKEWGFDVGGALKKDKLFWFYGFAQYKRNFPGTGKASSPGSFFLLPDAALASGYTCNLTNVMSGTPAKIIAGKGYISPASGGPAASQVDQMSCELAARMGYASYGAGATAYSTQLANLLSDLGPVNRTGDEVLNTPKLDWRINDKETLSVLFHRLRWDSPGGVQTQATNTYAIDSFGTDYVKLDYGLTKLDSLITTNLANEIRYQYGRELNNEGQQPLSDYTKKYLQGTNGVTAAGAGGMTPNVPQIGLNTSIGFTLGSPYYSYRKALPDETKWQVGDSATWQKGKHGLKFGVDMIHNYDLLDNTYESNGVFSYSYIGNYFADILNAGKSTGVCNSTGSVTAPGTATADLTGTAPCGTFVQGFGPTTWDINTMDYGFFIEDHWKLTPRLTADIGLRYDYESLPAPYSALTVASGAFTPYLASTNGLCAVYAGPGTCPALAKAANITNHPSDKNNIGPRMGIAWDPRGAGRTTIRAGYGLYYGRVTNGALLNNLLNTGSPKGQFVSSSFAPNSANAPLFPNIVSSGSFSTPTSYFFSQTFQNPQVHEFDVSLQQGIGHGGVFQLSYMGALGRELPNALNINLNPNPNTNANAGLCSSTVLTGCPNGVVQSVIMVSDATGKGPLANGTTFTVPTYSKGATTTSNLLNPNYGAVNELVSNINSSYHALVAEVVNKSSKLIQYDVNYTWSHALDNNQNAATTTLGSGWFDPYNIDNYRKGANYGNSNFNVPGRLVAWTLINSPEIQTNGWLKQLANHWSMNPVFQAQNGLPYSAVIGQGSPSVSAYSSSWNGAGSNYWIPAIGRNTYQSPRTMVLDLRLEKQFEVAVKDKSYHLQLLGEFFNLANHMNVTGVSTSAYNLSANSGTTSACSLNGASFGGVSGQAQSECSTLTYIPKTGSGVSASGFQAVSNADSNFAYSPRQVQVSLRLEF